MDNKYTGEVSLDIAGKPHTIVFDWNALAELKSHFAADEIAKVLKSQDPEKISIMLACGLKRHHPEMTAEKILKISPPFVPTLQALDRAVTYAYFGPGDDLPAAAAKDSKKKKSRATK